MSSKKLWELPEWKALRVKLLKDHCDQCGTKDGVMVLLHSKPMPKARQVGRQVRKTILEEKLQAGIIAPFALSEEQTTHFMRLSCPNCRSVSLRERKQKKPRFSCNRCGDSFEEPTPTLDTSSPDYWKLEREYYATQLQPFRDEINQLYTQRMEELQAWYLSGEDTMTYCNRCAYLYRKGKILCKSCKAHYHAPQFGQCYQCNAGICKTCGKPLAEHTSPCNVEPNRACTICGSTIADYNSLEICDSCVLQGKWIGQA